MKNISPKTKFLRFFRGLPAITKVGIGILISKIKGHRFWLAETEEDLKKVFRIRYEVYQESGHISENHFVYAGQAILNYARKIGN